MPSPAGAASHIDTAELKRRNGEEDRTAPAEAGTLTGVQGGIIQSMKNGWVQAWVEPVP